jgi:hypothetical protein
MCNFHVLNYFLLVYICKLHWNIYVTPDEQKTPHNTLQVFAIKREYSYLSIVNTCLTSSQWCDHPEKHPIDAPVYFISFVVISAFVMLSLFVGAITMSMSESMEELKAESAEKEKARLYDLPPLYFLLVYIHRRF